MPAIRKIRIVNFRFNEGTRLIPDEMFCTEDTQGKPIDTLLNLENGGGKSVLVQIMLQPICPKATVQKRSITDYFQSGTDHAFVLIEWALDGSSNSLLTGIALAAGTNADIETESKTIRYYTFLHNYARTGDKLDLINLPLTERTGNQIRAISFDDLRKKLQNGKVEYFASDDTRRYQKCLEEYGILHKEWENILIPINEVEGGISKFFEKYNTTDRLLDRFIIPGIMPNDKSSLEELEEMFLNYAKSYEGQEENLRLQSQITMFTDKLQEILSYMKNMWNAEDEKIQAIRLLADHMFTLEHHIKQKTEEKEGLEAKAQTLKEKLYHIRSEKASEEYYIAKDEYDTAEIQLSETAQNKEKAKIRREQFEHQIKVLNAAKEYADLIEQQNKEEALHLQLRELEQGDLNLHILSLMYSLFIAASEREKQDDEEYRLNEKQVRQHSEELQSIQKDIDELTLKLSGEKEKCSRLIGRKETLSEQINEGLDNLGVRIDIMLDERFSAEDISNIRANYTKRITDSTNKLQTYEKEEKQLEQELEEQNTKRIELNQQQNGVNAQLENSKTYLSQYRKDYNDASRVLEHLSIPSERIFSEEPLACLELIVEELQEKLRKSERSAEMLTEQSRCVENGQLHLSKSAVDFLQDSGIHFQTGERYILNLPHEIQEAILEINPLVAYSVIVDSKREQEKLLSLTIEDIWLSAIVPVYTRLELADMAEKKWNIQVPFLSAYDKNYFSDVSAYAERVRNELTKAREGTQSFKRQIDEWEEERKVLIRFSYPADYERQILADIDSHKKNLDDLEKQLSDLDNRFEEIQREKEKLKKLYNEQQSQKQNAEQSRKEFEGICDKIKQFEQLCTEISNIEASCKQLSDLIKSRQGEERDTNDLIYECKARMEILENHLLEYRGLIEELKDTEKADLLSDNYQTMREEYQLFQSQRSSDKKSLQKQIEEIKILLKKKESDLKRFGLDREEYETTEYTDTAYRYTEEQRRQSVRDYEQSEKAYTKADGDFKLAENNLKKSERNFKELNVKLLERSEVGLDFERRIKDCEAVLKSVESDCRKCEKRLDEFKSDRKYAARYATQFQKEMEDYTPKILEEIVDINVIQDKIDACIRNLHRAEEDTKKYHTRELEPFRSEHSLFTGTLDGIISVINNTQIKGDRYFTLYERTEDDVRRYRERIEQLSIILRDVEDSRKQLVDHCLQRSGRLYENLNILSKKSGVQIGNIKKQMIRIELPEVDSTSSIPAERINRYIIEQIKKYRQEESGNKYRNHLEIRRLLNCYIGKETIPVKVYKIDKNIQNSGYRSWENALKANSGGEQFVVLFSLVVSVMNYTRGITENLNITKGVLILDNPFGPISAPHLLEPMFRIAHHFNIQLICLTHLGTAAVTNCFDMVYQLRFRKLQLSNVEILESEAKQHIEHAFYLSEQLSLP
ncbi:MAG: hypothetical protein J1F28_02895 [Oscillospiraceae bacterium]|nr:hypothetical protein [Oscillospiraceae bacterium]